MRILVGSSNQLRGAQRFRPLSSCSGSQTPGIVWEQNLGCPGGQSCSWPLQEAAGCGWLGGQGCRGAVRTQRPPGSVTSPHSDPPALSLSPHGAFADSGDVLAWSAGWVLWLFMFWRNNSVYTPSLQTCPLYSTVLMHLGFFLVWFGLILISSKQQSKFRCVGEVKYLRAD